MKARTIKNSIIAIVIAAVAFLALMALGSTVTAKAEDPVYYICYASDDYKVSAVNIMRKSDAGNVWTVSPTLSRGDKFLISDSKGAMFGNEKGEPITVTESGSNRFTVTFNPNAIGAKVSYTMYAPNEYTLYLSGTESVKMEYRHANTLFDEYTATLNITAGKVVTVKDLQGQTYGESGIGTSGVTVTIEGEYRFSFTPDADNLYQDDKYISFEDSPKLYLLCEENNFTQNESYRLKRDETVISYAQYSLDIVINSNDFDLSYRILNGDNRDEYLPSESGRITVKDKGTYSVVYSPTHVYGTAGDVNLHTELIRVAQFYDGWYALGAFNDYTYVDSAQFDSVYKFVKDDTQTSYDEYKLTLYITDETVNLHDGKVEFFISDGDTIIRKPTGDNIVFERSGEYEVVFSPTHNYGRGYKYRYSRVGDTAESRTIRIGTADELIEFLAKCVSPEYSLNATVLLTADIDLTGMQVPVALVFSGTFDGMFRSITGFSLTDDTQGACMFKTLSAVGVIQNLKISLALDGHDYTAFVGECNGLIKQVEVSGIVEGNSYAAGVAASVSSSGNVVECTNKAQVTGSMNVGGVAGFNAGAIENCTNTANINHRAFSTSEAVVLLNVGGISGYSTGRIFACSNKGNVGLNQGRYIGGIVGLSSGGIYFCDNNADIGAEQNAGGIVGYYGRFNSADNNNPLLEYLQGTAYEQWLDRYFGSNNGNFEEAADSGVHEVYYCYNQGGKVYAETNSGGIAGHAGATSLSVRACVNAANVTAHSSYAGGIVGEFAEGVLADCVAYGEIIVSYGNYSGGIAGGSSAGTIEYCTSAAYVEAESYGGGIAGTGVIIRNCVSNAYVSKGSGAHFGAIAGTVSGNCEYNYFVATVVNGIDGVNYGADSNYSACSLNSSALMSVGMLPSDAYGLSAERFLAGESEPRYPVPRAFTDIVVPDSYTDTAAFTAQFNLDTLRLALSEQVGKITVTVTFYAYDFTDEQYSRLKSFRIPKGNGVEPIDVPEESGYFTSWDRTDFSAFETDTAVYMLFDRAITTLASDNTKRPQMLFEGLFHADTVVTLNQTGGYFLPVFTRNGEIYDYGDILVRYRLAEDGVVSVKLMQGASVTNAEFTQSSGYAVFTLPKGFSFAVVSESHSNTALYISLAAVGGFVLCALAILVVFLVKRKSNKKANLNADTTLAANSAANAENTETLEGAEAVENTETLENAEAVENAETVENTETVENAEAVENTETLENAETVENTETVENAEAVENENLKE